MQLRFFIALVVGASIAGCSSAKKTNPPVASGSAPAQTASKTPAPSVQPVPSKMASAKKVVCKRGSEVRSIAIESVQPAGCKLMYDKFGVNKEIASSTKGPHHCDEIKARIQKRLEGANFSCSE